MLERLFAPVQAAYRWLDDHPGLRLFGGLALFAAAILAPLPGWALDAWIVLAIGGALAMAALLLIVGDELHPREALAGLPAFLRRFAFHRLALALALTKAVLLGTGAGLIMEWLAQRGLGGSVGVGLAAIAAIYAARLATSQFPHGERLAQAIARLPAELEAVDRALDAGRIGPTAARRRREALAEEVDALGDGRQIYRLLRADTAIGVVLAACLIGAGLVTGLVFKGWPWSLTLSALTLYGVAEAVLTAMPGLVFGATLGQWLGTALDDATDLVREGDGEPERPVAALVTVEVGREIGPVMRRAFPEVVAVIRTRLARELGVHLPRIDLAGSGALPPRGYRVIVRGTAWARGEVGGPEAVDELAEVLTDAARLNAASLLTIDATRALLDDLAEEHPVAVAHALERHGLATIHAVMQGLLREQVPLRDVAGLLEGLVASSEPGLGSPMLVERLRRRLSLPLTLALADERGAVRAFELGPDWEEALVGGDDHALARDLAMACRELLAHAGLRPGQRVALIVPAAHRARLAGLLAPLLPAVAVLAPDELSPRCELRPLGTIERRAEIPWKAPLSLLKAAGS